MLGKEILIKMYEYNYWANQRLLEKAGSLSHAQLFGPAAFGHHSLMGTLFHILRSECIRRNQAQQRDEIPRQLQDEGFLTLEKLGKYWREEEEQMMSFLHNLKEEDLAAAVPVKDGSGKETSKILWHLLVQLVTHGIHHRSEAASILTHFGQSPGDLDFIFFAQTETH